MTRATWRPRSAPIGAIAIGESHNSRGAGKSRGAKRRRVFHEPVWQVTLILSSSESSYVTAVVRVDRFSVDRGIVEVAGGLSDSLPSCRQDENARPRSPRCGVLRRVRTRLSKWVRHFSYLNFRISFFFSPPSCSKSRGLRSNFHDDSYATSVSVASEVRAVKFPLTFQRLNQFLIMHRLRWTWLRLLIKFRFREKIARIILPSAKYFPV